MTTRWLFLIAIPATIALAPASAQERPASDLLSYYPAAALAAGVSGHVWLNCASTTRLELKDCTVLEEKPAGQGFGDAALKMAAQSKPNLKVTVPEGKNSRSFVVFTAKPATINPDLRGPTSWFEKPEWLTQPTAAQLAGFFPRGTTHQTGRVELRCQVAVDTTAKCQVTKETPAGEGFGQAALRASTLFRLSPRMMDGEPQDGGTINTAVNFNR